MYEFNERHTVTVYRLYVLFCEPLFWGPILIAAMQTLAHMTLEDIYYMESIVLGLCIFIDIPSGALADSIGRKKVIILGRLFLLVSTACFAFMTDSVLAWVGNIFWAIGYSLQSGADSSLLRDALRAQDKESEYMKLQGQAVGARHILTAFCSLVVGVLAQTSLRVPLYCSLPFMCAPVILACMWKEPVHTNAYTVRKQVEILRCAGSFILRSVEARWMILFSALIMTVTKIWFFTYNPYFELVGMPLAQYGVIFFVSNIVAWLASHYASTIEEFLGEKICILLTILGLGCPIIVMGYFPILACAYLVIVSNVVRGFLKPLIEDYTHHHVSENHSVGESNIRATVLSVQSTVSNLCGIIGLATFGFVVGYLDLAHSLIVLGCVCLVLGVLSYHSYLRKVA